MSTEQALYFEPSLAPHIGSPVVQGVETLPARAPDSDAAFEQSLQRVRQAWGNFWLVLATFWCAIFLVLALSR